jgi:hypothetical protein
MIKRPTIAPALETSDSTRRRIEAQIADPNVSDLQNPTFLFSCIATDLLLAITSGLIDPVQLAHEQLANRGLDADGQWAGFDRAREIHGVTR